MRIIDADAFIKRLRAAEEITEVFFGAVEPGLVELHKKLIDDFVSEIEKEPTITDCSVCPLKRP